MSSCCSNFTNFLLPDNIRKLLKKYSWIRQKILKFKNAQYLVLTNRRNKRRYFIQVVEEGVYHVELRRLNTRNNRGILITSRTFIIERPDLVAKQISELLKQDEKQLVTKPYPPGFMTDITCTITQDVGKGVFPWPDKVFAPYVDTTNWPYYNIATNAEETGVLYYILGFIVAASATNCTPTWATFFDICSVPQLDEIKQLRDMGGDVSASFGGQANTPIWTCATDAESLADCYKKIIDLYDFRRIDFDIEGAWLDNTDANSLNASALKILQDDLLTEPIEIWLTLPVATYGLTSSGLEVVQTMIDAGVNLTGINAMTMDYVPVEDDMGQASIDALTALQGQLSDLYPDKSGEEIWQMIGATPLIGDNDIAGETFTLDNAQTLLDFAQSVNMRLLSMWSSNRDLCLFDNEYSSIFNDFTT
ncbi:chitinase [Wukongibacter baidiensis]|uniref:chitinase n=1 Tax=Wukongibacter baidiensis TaxID=1723361 RepID=UPI003D7FD2E5